MKRRDNTVVIISILAAVALLVISYYTFNGKDRNHLWMKTYSDGNREPYDFGLFKSLLEDRAKDKFELVKDDLERTIKKHKTGDSATYIFIGEYCYLNKEGIDSLLNFAERGHNVIFIAEGLPDTLLTVLGDYGNAVTIDRFVDNKVVLNSPRIFSKVKNYTFKYRGFDDDSLSRTDWHYIGGQLQLDYYTEGTQKRYVEQGNINGNLNYARFRIGSGSVYIHTSPMLFTNYAMKRDSGFYYADECLGCIPLDNIIYDVSSRTPKPDSEHIVRKSDSPLSYILKQPALRWAWYVSVISVILFFMFRAKRRQRIIPVLEQKRNTSVQFIETMSGLNYVGGDHEKMAQMKMNQFLFFIRNKLGIPTMKASQETVKLIAVKSKVPEQHVNNIFEYYSQVIEARGNDTRAEHLMELYNRIDNFYHIYYEKK